MALFHKRMDHCAHLCISLTSLYITRFLPHILICEYLFIFDAILDKNQSGNQAVAMKSLAR